MRELRPVTIEQTPAPQDELEAARARYDARVASGKEAGLAERRRFAEQLRNRCLEHLVNLEELRRVHEQAKHGDLELLDRMIKVRPLSLDPLRSHDVDTFLRMPTIVADEAVSIIAMLESLADYERLLSEEAKAPPEERERIAWVRAEHLKILKNEWGGN